MEILKLIFAVALVAALAVSSSFAGEKDLLVVTRDDNGKEVTVKKGGTIEVRIDEPGATGYAWQVVDLDANRLELLDSGSTPRHKGGNFLGGPVLKTWRFKAVGSGTTELKFLLYRAWEGPDKAADRFQVRIKVL